MATSTLKLYQTDIIPERNAVVDNIGNYLSDKLKLQIDNFQYQKTDSSKVIKIEYNQEDLPVVNFNYVAIVNSDNPKPIYYFIVGQPRWLSTKTLELQLVKDTLNTFNGEYTFTEKTNIKRQHKDRYLHDANKGLVTTTITRKIDLFDEGIQPTKTLRSQEKILESFDADWYLIYKNRSDLTEGSSVPIDCFCCASKSIDTNATTRNGLNESDIPNASSVLILSADNEDFTYTTYNGTVYQIGKTKTYKALLLVKYDGQRDLSAFGITLEGSTQNKSFETNRATTVLANQSLTCHIFNEIISGNISYPDAYNKVQTGASDKLIIGSSQLFDFNVINRTDTRIVKIIKMPYAPFEVSITSNKLSIPSGWQLVNGLLKLTSLDLEFEHSLPSQIIADLRQSIPNATITNWKTINHSPIFESKLFNSNFQSDTYYYDNFSHEVLLERFSPVNNSSHYVNIKFKQSNNLSSNSLFKFDLTSGITNHLALYDEFLNVNRQNEVALYSSDYLNYIRDGYNYDKKTKGVQESIGTLQATVGAGTAWLTRYAQNAFTTATGISILSSALGSAISTVAQSIQSERAIQEKLKSTQLSPASVSNTEDLNLLSYYNGNRLIKATYSVSSELKQSIYNFFRLTGYACDDYSIPNTDTRVWYNFIQCEPDIDEFKWKYSKEDLDDIKARYQLGVTVYHANDNQYDFEQTKENFEKWLVNKA